MKFFFLLMIIFIGKLNAWFEFGGTREVREKQFNECVWQKMCENMVQEMGRRGVMQIVPRCAAYLDSSFPQLEQQPLQVRQELDAASRLQAVKSCSRHLSEEEQRVSSLARGLCRKDSQEKGEVLFEGMPVGDICLERKFHDFFLQGKGSVKECPSGSKPCVHTFEMLPKTH